MEEVLVGAALGHELLEGTGHHVVQHPEETDDVAFARAVGTQQDGYITEVEQQRLVGRDGLEAFDFNLKQFIFYTSHSYVSILFRLLNGFAAGAARRDRGTGACHTEGMDSVKS